MFTQFGKSINTWLLMFAFKILHSYFLHCSIINIFHPTQWKTFHLLKPHQAKASPFQVGEERQRSDYRGRLRPAMDSPSKSPQVSTPFTARSFFICSSYQALSILWLQNIFITISHHCVKPLGKTRVEWLITHLNPPKIPEAIKNAPRLFHLQRGTAAVEHEGNKKRGWDCSRHKYIQRSSSSISFSCSASSLLPSHHKGCITNPRYQLWSNWPYPQLENKTKETSSNELILRQNTFSQKLASFFQA